MIRRAAVLAALLLTALPALFVGLFYHKPALDAAWDTVKHWTIADHHRIRAEAPKLEEAPKDAEVVDLVAALRASVEAAKKRREEAAKAV